MTRAQFLGLFTLPFLTRFVKKEEPIVANPQSVYDGAKISPLKIEEDALFPYKNYAIMIPEGRPGHFHRITNTSNKIVVFRGHRVFEFEANQSIEV